MGRACIVGGAHMPFGKLEDPDPESLTAPVSRADLAQAGVGASDLDGIDVGVMNNGFSKRGFEAAQIPLGDPELAHAPATRLENACSTRSAARYTALDFIESGRGRIAPAVGAQKGGWLPANPLGDLMAGEYPVGAAGISMQVMICLQLMNGAGDMLIAKPELGGIFNTGELPSPTPRFWSIGHDQQP